MTDQVCFNVLALENILAALTREIGDGPCFLYMCTILLDRCGLFTFFVSKTFLLFKYINSYIGTLGRIWL